MESSDNTSHATKSCEDDLLTNGLKQRLTIPTKVARRDTCLTHEWEGDKSTETELQPRVLVLDHIPKEVGGSQEGRPRVVAREIHDIATLESIFTDGKDADSTLRVFYVQNCPWATGLLVLKFHINNDDGFLDPEEFAHWLLVRPMRRAGKPYLAGKSWKTTVDPWRRVRKCSFGLDYMGHYAYGDARIGDEETYVSGLMGYSDHGNPVPQYNVYSQRLSVYVQYAAPDLAIPGPVLASQYQGPEPSSRPSEGLCGNKSTIIIFDNSATGSIHDSLIPARGELENRWWGLLDYLTNDYPEEDEQMVLECMKAITQDIFKALVNRWERLLDASWEHVRLLEEKIYEQPADQSQAPELWTSLAHWHKYEKPMLCHIGVVNDMRKHLRDLAGQGLWLTECPDDFDRLSNVIQEDLVKRTDYLSDLMYKSVAFQDARESLKLGTSMWRLSWVTFIFLPLTFMAGIFGMNVDTFVETPSLKWYFIAAAPLVDVPPSSALKVIVVG